MDHPEICGKHKFNDARTRTKGVIDRQTQLRNICDVTDLISNWTFVTKYYNWNKGNESLFSFPVINGIKKWLTSQRWTRLCMPNFHLPSSVLFILWATVSDSWATTVPASYTHFARGRNVRWRCMGVRGYVNVVSYHVGNKRKTCSNPIFHDKGPDVKVGNVWELNGNCSDLILFGIVESVKS